MNSLGNKPITECGNCGFKDKWLLHYVRLRGEHRRLCTSCVLKLHPASFCSMCFEIFETSVPQHERVKCQKCPMISHPGCLPNSENVGDKYLCPCCSDPKYVFFDAKRNGDMLFEIDVKKSKVLLCAAKIALESMSRAVHAAEADALNRVKEATMSRKRVREALQEMYESVAKEKMRKLREENNGGGVSANGVGSIGNRNMMGVGSSAAVRGSSSNVGLQSRPGSQSVILGTAVNPSNGDAGRSTIAGNDVSANSKNADRIANTRDADGKT